MNLERGGGMNCWCGFKFAGVGEYRNCGAFIINGKGGVICPTCGKKWLDGKEIEIDLSKKD
jgi:hypothetical protein